jgi:hypothetical protein
MRPVGEGAKRTMGLVGMRLHRSVARALQHRARLRANQESR